MDTPTDDDARREDAVMRRVFDIAGRRPAVDPVALEHAEAAFRSALAPVVQRNRRQARTRRYARWSMAAAFVAALGIALWLPRPNDSAIDEPVATLVASRGPVAVVGSGAGAQTGTPNGTPKGIHVGQVLMTGPDGRASLRYRDADVRLDVATTVRFDAARLVLERGAVYVDAGARRAPGEPNVLIQTRFGMVGHTGTQFIARIADDRLIVGVREGTVFVKADADRRDLSATRRGAAIAEVGPSGVVDVREGRAFDDLWAWVPQLSQGFSADGRSVDAYLGWVSREYGYTVDYGDAATESHAKATLLHGDLGGLPIGTALDAVGATTDLDVDLDSAGELHVTSKRNHDSDGRNERQ